MGGRKTANQKNHHRRGIGRAGVAGGGVVAGSSFFLVGLVAGTVVSTGVGDACSAHEPK